MQISRSIISIQGALGRSDFVIRIIGAFVSAVIISILMSEMSESKSENPFLIGILCLLIGGTYLTLVSMVIRRVRDVFGTPIFDNLNSILFIIWASIPGIGFIAWILLCLIPGKITEANSAEVFCKNSFGRTAGNSGLTSELSKAVELHKQGVLSDDEFIAAKRKLIGSS